MYLSSTALMVAYKTGDATLLKNTGASGIEKLFTTGSGLDLMLGTDNTASLVRINPANGDLRLFLTIVNNETRAIMYHQNLTGVSQGYLYQSPIDSFRMANVEDVSSQVTFAASGGNYEFSVPLSLLGMTVGKNWAYRCDLGIVSSLDGATASNRYYWSASGFNMADLPAQARLKPSTWGIVTVKPDPSTSVDGAVFAHFNGTASIVVPAIGRKVVAYNPHAFPVRLVLLTMTGKTVADMMLKPGAYELKLPSLARTAYLYRISGANSRMVKGKITLM
jgi:hypothetical protein